MAEQGKKWYRYLPLIFWLLVAAGVLAVIVTSGCTRAREQAKKGDILARERAAKIGATAPVDEGVGREATVAPSWMTTASAAALAPTQSMLIRTASISLVVKDAEKAEAQARALAEKHGGFIAGSQTRKVGHETYATVTVRVPVARLDSLISEVSNLGRVTAKEQEAEEVTEEYVDLQSRLRNDTREEEQLLRLMQRAGKVSDLLQVEKTLAEVRGRIEQTTGRLRYLENRVALATLSIDITEHSRATAPIAAWSALDVVKAAVAGLLATLRVLATAAIWLVVFVPIILLIVVIWWAIRRSARAASRA